MDLVAIFLAKYLIYLLAAWAIVTEWLVSEDRSIRARLVWLFKIGLALVVLYLVMEFLRQAFPSIRPYINGGITPLVSLPNNLSFPSGHAGQAAVLAYSIFYIRKSWGIWAIILAGLVGLGRILVSAHYLVDVVAGLSLGILVSFAALKVTERFR